ncbi:hypothetical protein [Methylibium sp.]|uniref:hypothetical protein n=1 Tax=Methylibium sp. TaxID=2067992 RepID=UPI003D0AF020
MLRAPLSLHAVCHADRAARRGDAIKLRSKRRHAAAVAGNFFVTTLDGGDAPYLLRGMRTGVRRRDAINASDQRCAAHRRWAPPGVPCVLVMA